jgi:hypothetical protein
MNLLHVLFLIIGFFLLTPGIIARIPKNGNKYAVAGIHSILFAGLLWMGCFIMKENRLEGMDNKPKPQSYTVDLKTIYEALKTNMDNNKLLNENSRVNLIVNIDPTKNIITLKIDPQK